MFFRFIFADTSSLRIFKARWKVVARIMNYRTLSPDFVCKAWNPNFHIMFVYTTHLLKILRSLNLRLTVILFNFRSPKFILFTCLLMALVGQFSCAPLSEDSMDGGSNNVVAEASTDAGQPEVRTLDNFYYDCPPGFSSSGYGYFCAQEINFF